MLNWVQDDCRGKRELICLPLWWSWWCGIQRSYDFETWNPKNHGQQQCAFRSNIIVSALQGYFNTIAVNYKLCFFPA